MKSVLIAINSKYIHPNLAVRLLAANTSYNVEIREFTLKDTIESVISFINSGNYNLVGFSCYIWNIEMIKEILPKIHVDNILLGGPEVSYNAEYYIDNGLCDYVIKNEGERAFDMLLQFIDGKCELRDVPNLYFKGGYTFDEVVDISKIKPAYEYYGDLTNKIAYIESSRGCPYHCGYCMAGIDNNLRFFGLEDIKKEILLLQGKGAKTFKFLDRTFNACPKFTELLDFIIENHKEGESYQFEIAGDVLKPEIIDHINANAPKKLIRFEIGIQSTNEQSNLEVGRKQNNKRLFENIIRIKNADVIDMHLDLIAGLPLEDYNTFIKTFNDCLILRPKELQLGFLKLLRGTRLYDNREKYGYVFSDKAPYEIISNNYLSENDLKEIHYTEDAFDHYWNSGYFTRCMNTVLDNEENPFLFFNGLGKLTSDKRLESKFSTLDNYVKDKPYYSDFHIDCIIDYLNHFHLKPPAWWDERIEKNEKMRIYSQLCDIYPEINLNDCYKYGMVIKLDTVVILAIYKPENRIIKTVNIPNV